MRVFRRGDGGTLALAALLALAGWAAPAAGDPAGAALAPPGECAEPHAVRAAPDADALVPENETGDDFELAGSPRHHFTPQDVAAGAGGVGGTELPEPMALIRDACDAPNAGCGALLDDASRKLVESDVQPELPPGATQ